MVLTPAEKHLKRLRPLVDVPGDSLMVHEIYASIQGESTYAWLPCTFIRTTACHLRCGYCDTPHAFTQGAPMTLDQILDQVHSHALPMVELTGGEPLLQSNVLPLMRRLCDAGYKVLLETSGSLDIRPVDARVIRIMDLKTPSSGEVDANLYSNIDALHPHDEVKFVLGDQNDYLWAKEIIAKYDLAQRCTILMGTVHGALAPDVLVAWIVADHLPVRFQLQMHKVIWDPDARGV